MIDVSGHQYPHFGKMEEEKTSNTREEYDQHDPIEEQDNNMLLIEEISFQSTKFESLDLELGETL
jgi:hypothetical protein